MGRASFLDTRGQYSVIDLYRYAGPGIRKTNTGDPAYFSIDNGDTNLDSFNDTRIAAGDLADWAPNAGPSGVFKYAGADAFDNNSLPGQINGLSSTDLTLMGALGWDATSSIVAGPNAPRESAAVLSDFSWAQGWGSADNPRIVTDVNGDGVSDYVGFGYSTTFIAYGGTFSSGGRPGVYLDGRGGQRFRDQRRLHRRCAARRGGGRGRRRRHPLRPGLCRGLLVRGDRGDGEDRRRRQHL
jgi:hypothetical protein